MAEPPLSEPPVIVTDSTPPVTPAAAVGDPVPADVNATVLADRLCGALPPRVMRIVLPVGMVSAGVNAIVIVTEPVFLARLLSVMAGALLPSDPLTMATQVPLDDDSSNTLLPVTMDDAKVLDALRAVGLLTVSLSVTVSPPASVPVVNEIVRIDEEILAVAVGAPAVGDTTVTVDATAKGKAVNVIKILPLFGIEFNGVTVTVIVTEAIDSITLFKVMLGRCD